MYDSEVTATMMQVLPQGTNIQGVYLAFGLDGSVQLANSTYGISSVAVSSPALAIKAAVAAEAKAGAAAWQVTPLVVGQWYNLSVSIGRYNTDVSFLNWTMSGAH